MSRAPELQILPPTPVLETARLILRPIRIDDAPACQRKFPHWDVVRYLNARVPWPFPADGAVTHIRECVERMTRREGFFWAVTMKDDDELIGRIDLRPDDGTSRDQRGFWLERHQQDRGFITEAAERVSEFAFLELDWPQLFLTNAEANLASRRIKEKQGAVLIDRAPMDFVQGPGTREIWLLKREDWLARRTVQAGAEPLRPDAASPAPWPDKVLAHDQVLDLLTHGFAGRLATVDQGGGPHITPLLYVWDGSEILICGPAIGGGLRANVAGDDRVCFEIDEAGRAEGGAALAYRSVVAFGRIRGVEGQEAEQRFYEALVTKYSSSNGAFAPGFFERLGEMAVHAIAIDRITGRATSPLAVADP